MYDESRLEAFRGDSGLERYRMPVRFPPLSKFRVVTSDMPLFVVHKAAIQAVQWAQMWERRCDIKKRRLGLEMNAKRKDLTPKQKRKIAEGRTQLAQEEMAGVTGVFQQAVENPLRIDWEALKSYPDYILPAPEAPQWPERPAMPALPREPQLSDEAFSPALEPMDKLVKARREEKEQSARARYTFAHTKWREICDRIAGVHREQLRQWSFAVQQMKTTYEAAFAQWEEARDRYRAERQQCLPLIDAKYQAYLIGEPYAVLDYCEHALSVSPYPDFFPQAFDIDYYPQARGLAVDYLLPPLRVLPWLKAVSYDERSDTFHDTLYTEEERAAIYAALLYALPLRTLHELFATDIAGALDVVRFVGYVFLDEHPAPGVPPVCLLSIETTKQAFQAFSLENLNLVECFESLGGTFHGA
ncbi:MAG TPA: hypothetical protein P5141_03580 [Candidatus Hydrogenedentes bacterium]|nr:hypothetical protein [Candidatus Hydrogenedentota bacterium]